MSITYPDPLPWKLRVLHALTDAIKEITPDAGYESNLSDFDPGDGVTTARVYRGRAWFGDEDPVPLVSVLENDSANEVSSPPVAATTSEYEWPLLIQGFVNDDPVNPTDPAYVLLADVRRRLAAERTRKLPGSQSKFDPFGLGRGVNRVTEIRIGSGVVRPADDVSSKAYFWLPLVIVLTENAAEPYD